jgi:hypothetical protein
MLVAAGIIVNEHASYSHAMARRPRLPEAMRDAHCCA